MSSYEISKSSLLSLKAEILRKQQELIKVKADNEVKIKIIKKNAPLEIKNKGIEARANNDLDEEDKDLLKQSRSILEAKSKLYDKLSSGKLSDKEKEYNKRFLVRFSEKRKSNVGDLPPSDSEDQPDEYPESEEEYYQSDEDTNKDAGEKWVDYTDCLGRTRKCLQKDLAYIMSKDEELKKTVEAKRLMNSRSDIENNTNKGIDSIEKENCSNKCENENIQKSELLSSDMRRELLRQQWEKEEDELWKKSDIHYQDILFGEARTHGVGYYGFSKNEEERAKQQEALKKLREETEQKQKKAQELKAIREKQLAARIKAAKNRSRARLGLPPEEEEPKPTSETEISEEEKKQQEDIKQSEEEKEKLLEQARKSHIRPWDIGKEGVKEHYEMTQEEWVEMKRAERPEEFAPPSSFRKEFRSVPKDPKVEDTDRSLWFTTKKSAKRKQSFKNESRKTEIYQTESLNPYKSTNEIYEVHQNSAVHPTPIVNLCEETEFDGNLLHDYHRAMGDISKNSSSGEDSDDDIRGKGVEIAPPPSFDYYNSGQSKRLKIGPTVTNIQDSIEAGLKFLRKQVEEKEKSTKHPREMFLL